MTAILILGLRFAATVSIYSITAGVVLRPLPYESSEALIQLRQVDPNEGYEYGTSGPMFRDWQAAATSLELMAIAGFIAVLSRAVTSRRREAGIRIAIGAEPPGSSVRWFARG